MIYYYNNFLLLMNKELLYAWTLIFAKFSSLYFLRSFKYNLEKSFEFLTISIIPCIDKNLIVLSSNKILNLFSDLVILTFLQKEYKWIRKNNLIFFLFYFLEKMQIQNTIHEIFVFSSFFKNEVRSLHLNWLFLIH